MQNSNLPHSIKIHGMMFFLCIVLLGICVGQSKWEWRNPLPQGNSLADIAFGKDTYVAVGVWGTILTSQDGKNWIKRHSGTRDYLTQILFAGDRFVATGIPSGEILTSSDGLTWERNTVGVKNFTGEIAYIKGQYVASGLNMIFTSPDAKTWTKVCDIDIPHLESVYPIAYGNGTYVALGCYDEYGAILTSPNCTTWTMKDCTPQTFNSLLFVDSTFIISGHAGRSEPIILHSRDGIDWTIHHPVDTSMGITSIGRLKYVNDQFFLTSENNHLISPDGIQWKKNEINYPDLGDVCITYGQNQYVGVGRAGYILTSPNGLDWKPVQPGNITHNIESILYKKNTFFVLARNYSMSEEVSILTSPDGITWKCHHTGCLKTYIQDMAYGDNQFVAVGFNGDGDSNVIMTSPLALHWTRQVMPKNGALLSVAWGKNRFVAVGDGDYDKNAEHLIYTSADGKNWIDRTLDSCPSLRGVCFVNNHFLALGYQKTVISSPDGVNWTFIPANITEPPDSYVSAVYAQDLYVIVGSGIIITSPDLVSWKSYEMDFSIKSVTYANGHFVAAGSYGKMVISRDGEHWQIIETESSYAFNDVTHNDTRFVAVGYDGKIMSSDFDQTFINNSMFELQNQSKQYKVFSDNKGIIIILPRAGKGNHQGNLFTLAGRHISSFAMPYSQKQIMIPFKHLASGTYIISIKDPHNYHRGIPVLVK